MARQIRRVTKRTYDKYMGSDYPLGNDNLNPVRNTELEGQVNLILNEVHSRLVKAYSSAGIEYNDSYDISNPDIEGMGNDIDYLIKALSKNPLVGLAEQGFNIKPLIGSKHLDQLANPICIDCLGIPSLEAIKGQTSGMDATNLQNAVNASVGEGGGNAGGDDETGNNLKDKNPDDFIIYKIKYHKPSNVNGSYENEVANLPTTYNMASCPIPLPNLTCVMEGYKFYGWYLDENYSQKVANNNFIGYGRDVDLYAQVDILVEDEDEDEGEDYNPDSNPPEDGEKKCDVKELEILKVILVICQIIMILVKIVGTVLGIIVPLIQIVKEAQLAWINPPLMASIIQRVSQKLMALVFEIIGVLLMKLWTLLNFDCMSEQAIETLNEINQTLAGINNTIGAFDAVAMEMSGVIGQDWAQIGKDIKENAEKQWEQMAESWKHVGDDIGNAFSAAGKDWKDKFTDPKFLYSNAVPPEIRDSIETIIDDGFAVVDTAKGTMDTIQNMINTFSGKKPDQKAVGRKKDVMGVV